MTSLFFIDANIPIYAAGREHPLKEPCFDVLRLVFEQPNRFITNAEVLQELLHHYRSLRLLASGAEVVQSFSELMRGRVEPVIHEDVDEALEFAIRHERLSARDALHLAVMKRLGSDQIVTADRAFSEIPGVTRQPWRNGDATSLSAAALRGRRRDGGRRRRCRPMMWAASGAG